MATNMIWPNMQEVTEKLDTAESEVVLDCSSVGRIEPDALRALEKLAGMADGKSVRIVLRGVNVDVYKVLKLMKLSARFTLD